MLPPIPVPSDYKLSPTLGFLPEEHPLQRLTNPYYSKWESVIQNLQPLLLAYRLREIVDRLPVLDTRLLKEEAEWRRAYLILSFLAHGYIWGGEAPSERVPPSISKPYKEICHHLELPTVATYAGVCLWNWRPIFQDERPTDLNNLATLSTFTGSVDESWFYLVSVAIEGRGGSVIPVLLEAMSAARRNDTVMVTHALQFVAERIDELMSLLERMHDHCDPHIFYHHFRPFLAGGKGTADAGLPNGVIFDTGSEDDEFVQYSGGSNGQSSLIQFIDIALGVEHRPLKARSSGSQDGNAPPSNFIHEMRNYMPGLHRRFIEDVERAANIRAFVNMHSGNEGLVLAFNACLAMVRLFRDRHIQIVSRYIVVKSRESRAGSLIGPEPSRRGADPSNTGKSEGKDKGKLTGTGGTVLVPFLKQARDETSEGTISEWTSRLVDGPSIANLSAAIKTGFTSQLDKTNMLVEQVQPEITVLGDWWNTNDTEGGICHC